MLNTFSYRQIVFTVLIAFGVSFSAENAWAHFELNAFYLSDSLGASSSTNANAMTVFEACLGFSIDKKANYLVGWNYSSFSTNATSSGVPSDSVKYTSTQMGPRFLIMFDKDHNWSLGLGYYLTTSGSYTLGTASAETWSGTAYKVDLGYNFTIKEDFFFGVRMNYSSSTYTQSLVGTTYSSTTNTRTLIYPSLYTAFIF